MRRRLLGRQRAFTLIELLVVILIIGILIAVAAPSFLGQSSKAQNSAVEQNLTVLVHEAKSVWTTNQAFPSLGTASDTASSASTASVIAQVKYSEPQFAYAVGPTAATTSAVDLTEPTTDQLSGCEQSQSGTYFCFQADETGNGLTNVPASQQTTLVESTGTTEADARCILTAAQNDTTNPSCGSGTWSWGNTATGGAVTGSGGSGGSGGVSFYSATSTISVAALTGVSCPAATFCVAVDNSGNILTTTNGGSTWSTTASGASALSAVSCSPGTTATSGLCMAIAATTGISYLSTDPTSSWANSNSYSGNQPPGVVSCASTTLCIATTSAGQTYIGTVSGTSVSWVDNNNNASNFVGVSCTSTSFCAHIDSTYGVVYSTSPAVKSAWNGVSGNSLTSTNGKGLSCAPGTTSTAGLCVDVGANGTISTAADPSGAWADYDVDGTTTVNAVSCATSSFCAVADSAGNVLTSTNPTDGTSAWTASSVDPSSSLTAVSCTSSAFCVAVDSSGRATVFGYK